MKTYNLQSKNLTTVPDSVLTDDTEVLLLGAGWTAIGPLGSEGEAPERNRIKFLPAKICNLKNLRILDLSNNEIEFLPECFFEFEKLETLDLSFNKNFDVISNLPLLLKLKKLKRIELIRTKLTPEKFDYVRSMFDVRKVQVVLELSDLMDN